jgi:uncharacterized protein (TIGR02611 family)
MEQVKRGWARTPHSIRKPVVLFAGSVVLLLGLIMLITPGPGWAMIFLALAIYSTEFARAKKIRNWLMRTFKAAWKQATSKPKK